MTSDSAPTYAPGTPIWVDLGSSDLPASTRFYTDLFGWQADDQGEQMGHYTFFRQAGKTVCAVGPLMNPQQPVAWQTYISTQDAAASATAVRGSGGAVLVEPLAVMDQGSMAVFMDPTGAAFGVWQPNAFKGPELVNAPGSVCWNELETRDLETAKRFYPRVFGWGVKSNLMPEGGEYVEWEVDGRSVAGAMTMHGGIPPQVPPHWLVYFAVADTDATVSKAQGLGGKIMAPAMDIPQGRFAVIADPQGAEFGVIKISI